MAIAPVLSSKLKDPDLLVAGALIDGAWLGQVADGRTFGVTNPSTGEVLATLPDTGVTEAKANGYGPYYKGEDEEYWWYTDADSDGIVCE